MANLNDVEKTVYEVILRETEINGGVMQRKLKEIEELKSIKPRQLQHIVKRLIKMKLVRRLKVPNNGRTSYLLQAVAVLEKPVESKEAFTIKLSIDDIIEIPCLTCKYITICGTSRLHSSSKCNLLTKYLISKTFKSFDSTNQRNKH
uniref:B-block binding subunit of TFIIIC domain-containing protein n=1 Tax=Ignisphaera aggregans TaxID=334771 RepID=A0A7J2U263_9CREN